MCISGRVPGLSLYRASIKTVYLRPEVEESLAGFVHNGHNFSRLRVFPKGLPADAQHLTGLIRGIAPLLINGYLPA